MGIRINNLPAASSVDTSKDYFILMQDGITKRATPSQFSSGSTPLHSFGITVDGAGTTLTNGSKGFVTIPYDCTITNWYLAADQAGYVQFDIKRGGTSIIGTGNTPAILGYQTANAAVSGWDSVAVTAGDVLEFEITGTTQGITRVNLVIKAS